ncbi:class 1 fructose-bisphosphatase [Helicobacter fennelliae]|uniref:class 1 fructose-bisphosphatase n=1 Tax=Helicobacter fennelliae TaxID=215 RepID=UPI000DFF4AF6|nr:class 1 fructose-bisphosphatase [Helicobacter fennelliae]STQ83532.1 fructose-1,6-bisphosphatase [Helicobacter fennelliae]
MQEILTAIQECAIALSSALQTDNTNYLATTNSSGDSQLAIDVKADRLIEEKMLGLDSVKGVCSEEKQEAIYKEKGTFLIAYDPLDGSSLFDSDLSVGSIFGIYKESFETKNLVGASYIVYGPRLELVFASNVVEHYFYDGKSWILKPQIKLQQKGKINAPGGTQKNWSPTHKALVESFFAAGYRLRYSGGMVPDLHQILIKGGGIFSYPATSDAPNGKLRKLFEVYPFAFIYEKAGGEAISTNGRILDSACLNLHDTMECYFGSKNEIAQVRAALGYDEAKK